MSVQWVRVAKQKYPARPRGEWEARLVAEDEHGVWLFAPAGDRNRHNMSGVQLLARDQWWVAWWWDDPRGWWTAADVATPARLVGDAWTYGDLEIDVVGDEQGFLEVVDEDEFEDARVAIPYPDDVVIAALAARDEVVQRMRNRTEPFGKLGWERLRDSVAGVR
jgi:hypothetical protein